ncbi:MAG: hypothetical protein DRO40_08645 [Thermoprotei archaeon]|nr:MAG: hypothetical protein DRO40_08645 [Thermoprotei archaeon]
MKRINFIVPSPSDSFYYVAKYLIAWLDPSRLYTSITYNKYLLGAINVRVNDMWNEFRRPTRADIYWLDTPLYYNDIYRDVALKKMRPRAVWVASTWNLEMCRDYFDNCEYVPRVVHPLYLMYESVSFEEKEYDLAFVGTCWWRKGCDIFKKLCKELGLRCWMTGDYRKLSLHELIDKLIRTKFLFWMTLSEGFGLPLMEAQCLGIPALCLEAHTNLDYCYTCNLKPELCVSPVKTVIRDDITGRHKVWLYKYEDAREVVKEALSMSESEYNDLSAYVEVKARNFILEWVKKINDKLISLV